MSRHRNTRRKLDIVDLGIELESPSLVFQGNPSDSDGALLAGQIVLSINGPNIELTSFELKISGRNTYKKAFNLNCITCKYSNTVISRWRPFSGLQVRTGDYRFPFSCHVPGFLPATSYGALGSIEYFLDVDAIFKDDSHEHFQQPFEIRRALKPMSDQTIGFYDEALEVRSQLTVPSLIHPIGFFNVQLQLWNVCQSQGFNERRYDVLFAIWRIEERSSIISPACFKHWHALEGLDIGIGHTNVHEISSYYITDRFNTDFEAPGGGEIGVNFQACVDTQRAYACDVQTRTNFEVSHLFVLEVFLSERLFIPSTGDYALPSGFMTKLRMEAKVILAQKAETDVALNVKTEPLDDDAVTDSLENTHPTDKIFTGDDEISTSLPENIQATENISTEYKVSMTRPENTNPAEKTSAEHGVSMTPPENTKAAEDISAEHDVSKTPPENTKAAEDIFAEHDVSKTPPENTKAAEDIFAEHDVSKTPPENTKAAEDIFAEHDVSKTPPEKIHPVEEPFI